mmetsp:Transcript_4412/g.7264  ORF Transcript_4412/g.7264 Transcript_4412/m.7264 type:complete len:282 (+) Transcript_4412:402-1247(+)
MWLFVRTRLVISSAATFLPKSSNDSTLVVLSMLLLDAAGESFSSLANDGCLVLSYVNRRMSPAPCQVCRPASRDSRKQAIVAWPAPLSLRRKRMRAARYARSLRLLSSGSRLRFRLLRPRSGIEIHGCVLSSSPEMRCSGSFVSSDESRSRPSSLTLSKDSSGNRTLPSMMSSYSLSSSSSRKGGSPASSSYSMHPVLHRSTTWSYPCLVSSRLPCLTAFSAVTISGARYSGVPISRKRNPPRSRCAVENSAARPKSASFVCPGSSGWPSVQRTFSGLMSR